MKNGFAVLAIGLWVVTIAVLGAMFVRGNTAPAPDGRTAIILTPAERDVVLAEMRGMLTAVRDVADGLAGNRRADVVRAAGDAGGAATHRAPVALLAKLPLEFKRMGMSLHAGFDELAAAAAAEQGEATGALLGRLTGQLNQCVACHQIYRFDTGP
jgi:hypothetical protein